MISPTREQRAIIDHRGGPLRVEAGAGTGKTTTLALRIASLLTEGEVRWTEVLGLTFTNKAAEELASRVASLAGSSLEPGGSVEVDTYHGFAYQVVREFGPLEGIERSVKVITATFARQLLFDLVRDMPFEHLDSTYPAGIVAKAVKLSSELGDNLLTADDLLGVESPQVLGPIRTDLLTLLASYDRLKTSQNLVDFADLVRIAHRLATGHDRVAQQFRARYRLIVLDEYQDTNPGQRAMLQALFGAGAALTAVGDSDQTIYEWRGASLDNFASFPDHFPDRDGRPAPTLPLSINRRSAPEILDVANAISVRILGPGRLRPMDEHRPGSVLVAWYRTAVDEANAVAAEIERLNAKDGLAFRDMAILCRKNKDIGLLREALEDHGIPAEVANLGGLMAVPEIVEIRAWLRLLADPADGVALARLLTGSRLRLGLRDLLALAEWAAARDTFEDVDEDRVGPAVGLAESLDHLEELELPAETAERLRRFRRLFRKLLESAQGTSLVELTRQILSTSGMWHEIAAMPDAARLSTRLNLYRFLDLTEEWSPLDDRPSLEAFLSYLELMEEEQAEELDAARLSNENAVSLLTVHRAKGLEWEVVFLPALYENNFPARSIGFDDPDRPEVLPYRHRLDRDSLPPITDDMSAGYRRDLLRSRHYHQEWRIAYVAVTRARRYLYASGAHWVGAPHPLVNPVAPSPLWELVEAVPGTTVLGLAETEGPRPDRLQIQPGTGAPDPLFENGWPAALREGHRDPGLFGRMAGEAGLADEFRRQEQEYRQLVLSISEEPPPTEGEAPFRTSVTGLVTYATCPKRFYWAEVDRLPRRTGPAARWGVEVHRRIELHNLGVVPLGDLAIDRYDVIPGEAAPSRSNAFEVYRNSRFARSRPRFVEAPFDLLSDRLWIRGRIDAIYELEPGDWEIVDFKTGHVTDSPAAVVQLQAYAIAARDARFAPDPPHRLRATFAYLGGDLTEQTYEVDASWERQARAEVERIGASILKEEWEPRPSAACRSCDFLSFCRPGQEWVSKA